MTKEKIVAQIGEKFAALTVVDNECRNQNGKRAFHCACECGSSIFVAPFDLKNGRVKSCGCQKKARARLLGEKNKRHGGVTGGRRSATYLTWQSMLLRCNNPKTNGYANYGGRGISVCHQWTGERGFDNFIADMGERPEGLTLDRIDVDGDYEPSNCKWSTMAEQKRNRRTSKLITYRGETLTAAEWAERVGTHRNNILRRLKRGLPLNEVLRP